MQPRTASSTAASRPVLVLGAIFAALPFVILFAPNYLEYCLIGGVLATPQLESWRESYRALEFSPITRAVSALLIWIFATTLWAEAPERGDLLELAALSALGVHLLFAVRCVGPTERGLIASGAVVSFMAATVAFVLIATLKFFGPVGGAANPFASQQTSLAAQSAAAFVALCWPLIGLITTARIKVPPAFGQAFVAICLVGLTVGFFRLSSLPGLIAIAMGGAALLLVSWRVKLGVTLLTSTALAYLLLAPTIHVWPPSEATSRNAWTQPLTKELVEWHEAADYIFAKPVFGYGYGSPIQLEAEDASDLDETQIETLSPPRNLFLLIWLNVGLVGVILFVGVIYAVAISILRAMQGPLQAALMSASALSILAPAVLGAGTLDLYWVASSWCIGAACLLLNSTLPIASRRAS